jgi:hypothetical protein
MSRIRVMRLGVAQVVTRTTRRSWLPRALTLVLAMLVSGAAGAIPAHSSSSASALEAEALTRARIIRAEVTARYRQVPGRKLVVTEATPTGVVESITLVTDWLEPARLVPAGNGIYFAICSARATCPYPARSAAWPLAALMPRRQALELAVRALLETSVDLVVVALPTARPSWVVVERDDLCASIDLPQVLDRLTQDPAVSDSSLMELLDRLTRPRLFLPLPILPPPDDTIYAVQFSLTDLSP